ncbi:peptidoglycan D,D-transpeptidase FtsI family protein [Micrococcoides hystricis]|uniref:Peptidoglycan D,D-transpeptidase FtsI family protein n=1 Tax=Micrococcoides hystricis TaxID=1572761 RepID=A0ABV6P6S0_9MICC
MATPKKQQLGPLLGAVSGPTNGRLRFAVAAALVLLMVLGGRLFVIQGLDLDGKAIAAAKERTRTYSIPAERGSILDSKNNVLAMSVDRYNLVVDQTLVADYKRPIPGTTPTEYEVVSVDQAATELAKILNADSDTVKNTLTGDKRYQIVAKNLLPEVKDAALDLKIPALVGERIDKRVYPSGAVGGSVLGFLSGDGTPLEGIERTQDEILSGTPGEHTMEIGADGIRIATADSSIKPAENGKDIRLTIDQDIQWFAQEAISAKVRQYRATWGNIVVTDAKTGEILAMADSTTVDPANPGKTDELFRQPLALTRDYEPGSTGKVATFAAALDSGAIKPLDNFRVPNKQTFTGETINDSMRHPTFDMTAAGVFARSYNTGTVQVANKMDNKKREEYMRKFGIGSPIDIGLNTSSPGVLAPADQWDRRQQYTTSFGQGYTVTNLHSASIFQTIANDGVRVPPQLIDAYISADGKEEKAPRKKGERVVSKKTAQEMLRMMEAVVEESTGVGAKIPGYRVGGKTGTGEVAVNGVYDGYVTSFTGIAPLDDPRFVVSVIVYRPQGDWKDWTVTDTFAQVMGQTLNTYNVPPSGAKSKHYKVFTDDPQKRPWE